MLEFGRTQKFIATFNAKKDTHFLGHNAYSDWSDEERSHFLSSGIVGHLKHHDARLNAEYIPGFI